MITQIAGNGVCWAILLLAFCCYQQIWQQYLTAAQLSPEQRLLHQQFCNGLIATLPLLGLLGTIIGLLQCFAGLAEQGASGAILSGGIADALLTTQLGLVFALLAWVLQGAVRARLAAQPAGHPAQPACGEVR